LRGIGTHRRARVLPPVLRSEFPAGLGKCAVGLAAVADADDQDDELGVGDLVDNPVIADTEPVAVAVAGHFLDVGVWPSRVVSERRDRKSTRLNSSHVAISYAVFCLKKKK